VLRNLNIMSELRTERTRERVSEKNRYDLVRNRTGLGVKGWSECVFE